MNLIIGNGLIGRHLYYLLREDAVLLTRKEIDLSRDSWNLPRCDIAFICAAITSTAECESNPEKARLVNVTNTIKLVKRLMPSKVVWISSERVFDGSKPFRKRTEEVCPVTEYGRQKVETEVALLEIGVTAVRLSKVLGWDMPLFEKWIDDLINGRIIRPYSNMSMSPLPIGFVVEFLSKISKLSGLFQLSALEDLSYDRIAYHIANRIGVDISLVQPVQSEQGHPNTTLDDNGIAKQLGMNIPDVWDTLDRWCEKRLI